MKIKILGSGCAKCRTLENNTRTAVKELNLDAEIIKITDVNQITDYGVMMTPAIVVDEKVLSYGKVLSPADIKALLN